ncbi:hypothetical protein D3C85_1112900 [compost metagenome]
MLRLVRQRTESVDQFGRQGFAILAAFGVRQTAIQAEANVQVWHVSFWNQDRRANIDRRRPAPIGHFLALLAQFGDGVFQHLLIQLDPDLADMARLLVAQQVAAAALIQIVTGQLEAGAQIVQRLQHLQTLLGRQAQRPFGVRRQIGECPRLGPSDTASDLVQLGQAEHVGAVDDQRVGRRNVDAALDNGGRDQDVITAVVEGAHHVF